MTRRPIPQIARPLGAARRRAAARRPDACRPEPRHGFTLNELLVVIAIAVLVLALAVPAFNVITNSRSIDSAENLISAYLGSVRAEAVGVQEPRGAIFFEDPVSGRFVLVPVLYNYDALVTGSNRKDLDLVGNRDELVLPNGVGLQVVPEGTSAATQNYPWTPWGVIMFDRDGNLMNEDVRVPTAGDVPNNKLRPRLTPPAGGPALVLRDRNGNALNPPVNNPATPGPPPLPYPSAIGFILYDKAAQDELPALPASTRSDWLRDNASPYLVNRYNGTLLKGE